MGFRIGNNEVIDNSRNLIVNSGKNIKFSDNTYQLSALDVGFSKTGTVVAGGSLRHTLINPNAFSTLAGDVFGSAARISGNRCIVGAYGEDDASGTNSGKAYIFDVTTGALLHTLNNPNPFGTSTDDWFGLHVAIFGNRCLVSARQEDDSGGTNSGIVYVFNVTTGELIRTINNPNVSQNDEFGRGLAIRNNRCIIGSPGEGNVGAVYIYDVETGTTPLLTVSNPRPTASDSFGITVDISDTYFVIGSGTEDDFGSNAGIVYVYNLTSGALLHTITNPNAFGTVDGDFFGTSVSISGNIGIFGASAEDSTGILGTGRAYIYNLVTGSLLRTLSDPTPSSAGSFGDSVAIHGNICIVATNSVGRVYLFNVSTGALLYSFTVVGTFNYPVSITENYCIIGVPTFTETVPTTSNSSGRAYIYSTKDLTLLDMIYTTACSP